MLEEHCWFCNLKLETWNLKPETRMPKKFGLVGRHISYSFSRGYFTDKFEKLGLYDHSYQNFDLDAIGEFPKIIRETEDLLGLNVTIPYKEEIIPYLDDLDPMAKAIGAVNTIHIKNGRLTGHNTDAHGFMESLGPLLRPHHQKALILGTGGASKAIVYVLGQLGLDYAFVSRNPNKDQLSYGDLNGTTLQTHTVIVNCTPLGTYPNILDSPKLPYDLLNDSHLLYDLIYNPEKTAFLKAGEAQGAAICNGMEMLRLQAEKAWKIWNS